jgi:phage terminase Nu1 subunit (DNA packaging protein)
MDTTSSELSNRAGSLRAAYFTKAELAAELDRTVRTIDRWLAIGEGPPVTLLGREQIFRKDSVAAWLASRERQVVG